MTAVQVGIIGAGGRVGSNLMARMASDSRLHLRGICRNEVTAGPLRMAGYDVQCGSVADPAATMDLLGDCEVIVNCAAASGAPGKTRTEDQSVIRALCGLPGKRRLIHFSSVGVYGTCIDPQRNTFAHPRPDWAFGRDKLHLERYLARCLRLSAHECVVLRMGHVYGAGQWVSRRALEMIGDPRCRLPFDGQLPSNAVHVRNVAAAIRTLILDWTEPEVYNLFDAPASTWRQVFDWHTTAIGTAPVAALSAEEAERCAAYHQRIAAMPLWARLGSEMKSWVQTLPGSFVSACPSAKNLGSWVLSTLRMESLEQKVQMRYFGIFAEESKRAAPTVAEPWLLCGGAPGRQLPYRAEVGVGEARELAGWHARYASPDALLQWEALDHWQDGVDVSMSRDPDGLRSVAG